MSQMTAATRLYKKRLEGVKPSKELKDLVAKSIERIGGNKKGDVDDDDDNNNIETNFIDDDYTNIIFSDETNDHQLLTSEQACRILKAWLCDKDKHETLNKAKWIPIAVIRATEALLDDDDDPTGRDKLEQALHRSALVFTPTPPNPQAAELLTDEQKKFRKRLERLRLKQEERKYSQLTSNLGLHAPADDITTRSMTYAASIGLNMIIAPLSFGFFMYFFAGGVMNFLFSNEDEEEQDSHHHHHQGPDIRRVIMGVISGVGMMFIEMLLFVIRTHEMDKAMRKKAKKNKDGAFGHYTSKTSKTYQD